MFTLFAILLGLALLVALSYIGLWIFGIVLFVKGCCNIWKAKWLEPNDFVDRDHMERARKRTINNFFTFIQLPSFSLIHSISHHWKVVL